MRAEAARAGRHRFGAVARHAPVGLAALVLELTNLLEHGGCCPQLLHVGDPRLCFRVLLSSWRRAVLARRARAGACGFA